jgi:hypothetical protein
MVLLVSRTTDGCMAKLARAKLHRDALQEDLARTLPTKQIPMLARKDEAQPGENLYTVYAGIFPDFPELVQWGALIGDAIHDLRTPLDHLAWAVVLSHLGREPDQPTRVNFPIESTPARFKRAYAMEQLDTALRVRFEFYQPYKAVKAPPGATGEIIHPLALLKTLSNDDKHKVITPLVTWPQEIAINADPLGVGVEVLGMPPPAPLEEEAEIMLLRAPNAPDNATEVEVGTVGPSVSLSGGVEVIEALDGIAAVVAQAVREFEPLT